MSYGLWMQCVAMTCCSAMLVQFVGMTCSVVSV